MPKVIQLFNDKPFAIYSSIGSAARKTGIKYNYIQDAIHGRRGGCRGFKFRFATDEEEKQYKASIKVSNKLPFIGVGDRIEISYNRETALTDIVKIK